MGESAGHNIYTFLTVIAIIGGVLLSIKILKPSYLEAWGIRLETETPNSNLTDKNIEGKWEMTFDFARCSNPEFANKQFKCFYNIRLFQEGKNIQGTGNKHSESYEGIVTRYAKEFPIKIEGKITNENILVANLYEQNSFKEVVGIIEVPLDNKFTYDGIYKGQEGNCDGNIQLKRVFPKPNSK